MIRSNSSSSRMLLWVDAVGGYLVCQSPKIRLGQAVPGTTVDVPLQADLSRHHATIHRDTEGYVVEPVREVRIDGQPIDSVTLLSDGCTLELGTGLKLRFRKPHALSTTARLEFASRHGTHPSTTAVLLMADVCVLGPASTSHVQCRDWKNDVVLHRQSNGLFCCTARPFEVDGHRYSRQGPLTTHSRVVGEEFSFTLEEL